MGYNANQIGLELHSNFYIYTNKLDRLIRKKGKQEVLEMNWDANEEYSPSLLNDYSNHKEQSRVIKTDYSGSIAIHTVVKQYAVSAIKKYVREYGNSVAKVKKIKDPIKLQKPVKAKKVKTEEVLYTQAEYDKAFERGENKGRKDAERKAANQIKRLTEDKAEAMEIAQTAVSALQERLNRLKNNQSDSDSQSVGL